MNGLKLQFPFLNFDLKCSTAMTQLLLLLLFLYSVHSSTIPSSSWSTLSTSPSGLCLMPRSNFRFIVYEQADSGRSTSERHKYYYVPITLLDQSSVSDFNNMTDEAEMRFRIEMWNDNVENRIVNYVSDFVGPQVNPNCVQVMPLEKVVLANTKPSPVYSVSSNKPYKRQNFLWFSLTCFSRDDSDQLADNMRAKPQQFRHFCLALESQTIIISLVQLSHFQTIFFIDELIRLTR